MRALLCVVLLFLSMMSCVKKESGGAMPELTERFVYSSLALSPTTATAAGYHRHGDVSLDEQLDDYSDAGIQKNRQFFAGFRSSLEQAVKPGQLSRDERADYDIIEDGISGALLEADVIQSYRHNPTLYVEAIGNALYTPSIVEYAPLEDRSRHIIARLRKVGALLDQAKKNLVDSPEIWTKVAIEENDGNVKLINDTLRKAISGDLQAEYDRAAGPALQALLAFDEFLKNDLSKRASDWRLGKERYAKKFLLTLGTDQSPEQVLAQAEADLQSTRKQMFELSQKLLGKQGGNMNDVINKALDRVAAQHATRDTYIEEAKRNLEQATKFVRDKGLLTLSAHNNLQVIETPEFMRGIYAVGGFVPAPALEPNLGAFYWITPIPKEWPEERVESKLREYNTYGLQILTIHEAMPGHYVQFEYANGLEPKGRRLLRSVYGSGPYVEGWAVYATEIMLDEGYLDNSPELRLTFQKQMLRVLANTILDIRLHTLGMTDQEAMDLMVKQTFQEKEEATAKLQRAKLSSCQLPTYYVGWRDWVRLHDHMQKAEGASFDNRKFREAALKASSVPLPALARLLTGKGLGE